jgi:biopolymer transport protein ExbD
MAGGGSSKTSGGKKRARIEIIPLIDVIFFLLATFVLFTLSLNKSNGLSVSLPESTTAVPRDPNGTVTVSVTQDARIGWDKDEITLDEFINRLKVFHLQHPEPDAHILINGDKDAMFSQAVYVLDEARRAGIQKVLIETTVNPSGS